MTALLIRTKTGDQGTFGQMFVDFKAVCFIGELPQRDNKPNISCIPAGFHYTLSPHKSPRFGKCLIIRTAAGRSFILAHAANYCGDASKGYRTDLKGCLATGTRLGSLNGQDVVLASKTALNKLMRLIKKPTRLIIWENFK